MAWQGYLQILAHDVRTTAMEHPAAFPLVASRHPAAPWLRPPLRSIDLIEHLLTCMTAYGFDDPRAVDAYKVFTSFLVGSLLLEVTVRGENMHPIDEPLNEGEALIPEHDDDVDLNDAPLVRRMQDRLSEDTSDLEFEIGLETLVDRIERSVSQ
ncbi:MAG: TetR/AcrR family transcriptional regulator C-terminal domain-containing protein [Ornithinimicrobium sp.]|uniref:TetR/AcrR family transcriptional regulator C-terminal domain-containing protein n=1 Tax=Ornithinimicrobium sp. TaxID=1977084 RepID=UPI003D9BF18D